MKKVRIPYDHFVLLIFGQGLWKESFTRKISKDTKASFFHLSGYSKDSLFCSCPICNALVKLFDPSNPGEYVDLCDLCIPLYKKFEHLKGQNEGMIFMSHSGINDEAVLHNLTNALLSNDKVKKIYILDIEYTKILKEIPKIVKELQHKRIPRSELKIILENNLYEKGVIYEVFKDKYY